MHPHLLHIRRSMPRHSPQRHLIVHSVPLDHSSSADCSRRSCRDWNPTLIPQRVLRHEPPEHGVIEPRPVVIDVGARDPFASLPAIGLQGQAFDHVEALAVGVIVVAVGDLAVGVGEQADRAFAVGMVIILRSRARRRAAPSG